MPLPLPLMVPAAYYYYYHHHQHDHLLHSSSYSSYNSCLAMPKCGAGTWVRPRVCSPTWHLCKAWSCKASCPSCKTLQSKGGGEKRAEPSKNCSSHQTHTDSKKGAAMVAAAAHSCHGNPSPRGGWKPARLSEPDWTVPYSDEWWGGKEKGRATVLPPLFTTFSLLPFCGQLTRHFWRDKSLNPSMFSGPSICCCPLLVRKSNDSALRTSATRWSGFKRGQITALGFSPMETKMLGRWTTSRNCCVDITVESFHAVKHLEPNHWFSFKKSIACFGKTVQPFLHGTWENICHSAPCHSYELPFILTDKRLFPRTLCQGQVIRHTFCCCGFCACTVTLIIHSWIRGAGNTANHWLPCSDRVCEKHDSVDIFARNSWSSTLHLADVSETLCQRRLGHYTGQHQRYGHKWISCQIRDCTTQTTTILIPPSESHTRQFEPLPFPKRLKCDSVTSSRSRKLLPSPPSRQKVHSRHQFLSAG